MIVEIFVAQRQTVDPLGEHFQSGVPHLVLVPPIEKTRRQPRQQIQTLVRLSR